MTNRAAPRQQLFVVCAEKIPLFFENFISHRPSFTDRLGVWTRSGTGIFLVNLFYTLSFTQLLQKRLSKHHAEYVYLCQYMHNLPYSCVLRLIIRGFCCSRRGVLSKPYRKCPKSQLQLHTFMCVREHLLNCHSTGNGAAVTGVTSWQRGVGNR